MKVDTDACIQVARVTFKRVSMLNCDMWLAGSMLLMVMSCDLFVILFVYR